MNSISKVYKWVTTDLGFTSHTYQAYREERRVDYVGELILEDGAVYRRTHEAGWTDAQGREVAAVHDYRGSLRATWTDTSTGNTTGGGTTAPFIPGAGANTKIYGNLTAYYPYGLPWADWQGTDRYLFSGKELEREHGLFTYDFHARPYDPGLCRFTQPDPMATKYERLNAFIYCAANPISITDPSGCEFTEALNKRVTEIEQYINHILDDNIHKSVYNAFLSELSTLRESDQIYDIQYGITPQNQSALASTVYDNKSGYVVIEMYGSCNLLELIAHELEHCYQFDIEEYSMSYREDGVMYRPDPNDPEIGHLSHGLYDRTDEKKAYGIQSLFDGTGQSKDLYKSSLYTDLPDENFNSKDMFRNGIKYSPQIYINKLQQASNVMGIVFRHDGIKYEPQELKSEEEVNK